MEIGKSKDNYNKDGKLKYFNCNVDRHITKNCQKSKKKKETRKYYKCNKVGYLVKDCRIGQKMKNRSVQKDSGKKNDNKQKDFVRGLE